MNADIINPFTLVLPVVDTSDAIITSNFSSL